MHKETKVLGRCKNCKYWTGPVYAKHYKNIMRSCEHPKANVGYSLHPDKVGPDELLIEGDEGWGWYSGPEFGCIHFKEQDGVDHAIKLE